MLETQTPPNPISLETDQSELKLTQMLTPADDVAYFGLQNDNLDYWREFGNAIDESEAAVTKRRLEHGNGRFGIWLGDKLIGMVGYSTKRSNDDVEIGILLTKQATGHGYATSAIKALTVYAKSHFKRVYAEVEPNNERSIGLLLRAGYKTTGERVTRDWGEALVFEAPS